MADPVEGQEPGGGEEPLDPQTDPTTEPDAGGEGSGSEETPAEGGIEVTDKRLNSFNQSEAAEVAAKMVAEDAFLAGLISRNGEDDLLGGGGKGRAVSIKIPAALIARKRDIDETEAAIKLDSLTEGRESITLGTHIYSAVGLGEGEMNLDLKNFSEQVLSPQTEAVSEQIEADVARALNSIPVDCASTDTANGRTADDHNSLSTLASAQDADLVKVFTQLRKLMRDRGLPQTGLNVVVGTEVYAKLLDAQVLTDASMSGSTAALREGSVGKLRGFTLVESTRVDENDIIAFHRDAFVLAVRAPIVPAGQFGGVSTANGFQLRWLRDYDTMHTLHRSMVSTFAGVAAMPLYRVERDPSTMTARVVKVENGGAIHITTDATRLAEIAGNGTQVGTSTYFTPALDADVAVDTVEVLNG